MHRKLQADLSLMFCSLVRGVAFVVVKAGLDHASPFAFLAVRFSIAAILMVVTQAKSMGAMACGEWFAGMRLTFFLFAGYCFQVEANLIQRPLQ